MLRLREIMTEDVLTVSASTSLQEAAELFSAHHVSGAPVVDGGRVVGVVSMSDIIALAASPPDTPSDASADSEEDEDDGADREDWARGPSTANEPSARYFTDLWSDASGEVTERMHDPVDPEWGPLSAHTVADIMTRAVLALPPDADVPSAAARMRAADVHRILVMEDGVLRGIVTTVDVAHAVADDRLVRRTYVFGPPRPRRIARGPS